MLYVAQQFGNETSGELRKKINALFSLKIKPTTLYITNTANKIKHEKHAFVYWCTEKRSMKADEVFPKNYILLK